MAINKNEYGRRYGVNESTVRGWVERGMPQDTDAEATAWIVENILKPLRDTDTKEQIEKARLRKLIAEAEQAETELDRQRELLIPADEVYKELNQFFKTLRDYFRTLPNKIQHEVFEQDSVLKVKRVLQQRIDEMLTEIGDMKYEIEKGKDAEDENKQDSEST
ncbi:hypothetical protein [Leclercia sp. GLN_9]|uniref:hypothetical protein n=1 Tax=Leclercia sp. GLN_9 TaxID=3367184 RepID=UPI00370B2BAE